jgi:phenylpropionate dioxygenase-like ring-hydroxylating dioxygenase large terminal subunit
VRPEWHDLARTVSLSETLPSDWYVDPGHLEGELERVFDRSWQYAGPAELVAEPGTYLTTRAGRVPIVVTRDTAGGLNAFVNVCRHRGAEVARERNGKRNSLQCHYHAWTYGLDGRLRAAPRTDGLDLSEIALPRAGVGVWGPFVFVNPEPDAAPLEDALGELPAIVADAGIQLDVVRPRRSASYEIEANWKLVVDNYLECYHCPVAHPGFSKAFDVDDYTLTEHPTFSVQRTPGREAGEGLYAFLWPNFTLNAYPGPGNVSVNLFVPLTAGRTLAVFEYYLADEVTDDEADEFVAFVDQVQREDTELCESAQRGLRSGRLERGLLVPGREDGLRHFQRLVTKALQEA